MAISAEPDPAMVFDLINSFQRTAALKAAVELEVFSALGEGHSSAADLARRCGATATCAQKGRCGRAFDAEGSGAGKTCCGRAGKA